MMVVASSHGAPPRHPAILVASLMAFACIRDRPHIADAFMGGTTTLVKSASFSKMSTHRRSATEDSPADEIRTTRPATVTSAIPIAVAASAPPIAPSIATTTTIIEGLSSSHVLDNYDTFLLDMWGVLHDGNSPYEGVLDALSKLKESGKRLIILSNSSKRRDDSERMLVRLGFDLGHFDDIVTSGDVTHRLLRGDVGMMGSSISRWPVLDDLIESGRRNVYVFGSGDDDVGYCASAGWRVSSIEDADLILARGTFTINDGTDNVISKDIDETLYWEVMERSMAIASRRRLPMLVSNPDKVRPDPDNRTPMPGAIGDAYERFVWTTNCHPVGDMSEEGARSYVRRIGKPFGEVYDIALSSLSSSALSSHNNDDDDDDDEEDGRQGRGRIIMIGDAIETDVVGGGDAGIDVLWVTNDGIHGADVRSCEGGVDGTLDRFNRNTESTYAYGRRVMPRYATDHFRW
jgi:HAD superfamily hydrolase (TIGR01450 family)